MKRAGITAAAAVAAVGALVAAAGCQSMSERQWKRTVTVMDKVAEYARTNGLAYDIHSHFNGHPGLGTQTTFFLDTGVTVDFHLQGNAKGAPSNAPVENP